MADAQQPKTWDDISLHWDDWGSPLRPNDEDARIMCRAVSRWMAETQARKANVFLCGITPEIAAMDWPCPIDMFAMDLSEGMVKNVWPGDIPGKRRAVVGDWFHTGMAPKSQDIIVGDGGYVFFDFPAGQRRLTAALHALMKPTGLFIYRLFAQATPKETLHDIHASIPRAANFHAFRWRLAMATQQTSETGVRQQDIWQACIDTGVDPDNPLNPAWTRRVLETIRFSKDKQTRYYFPTLEEFRAVLAEYFQDIEVVFPEYELGERCPILIARPRPI